MNSSTHGSPSGRSTFPLSMAGLMAFTRLTLPPFGVTEITPMYLLRSVWIIALPLALSSITMYRVSG